MSYTMTIDEPEKAAWFERERATMSDAELGALFVVFLKQHLEARKRAMPAGRGASYENVRPASIVESLAGVAKGFKIEDDHGILARAALEKYERISQ